MHQPLVVFLPRLHIKLRFIKIFVEPLDTDGKAFLYVAKLKEGIFIGTEFRNQTAESYERLVDFCLSSVKTNVTKIPFSLFLRGFLLHNISEHGERFHEEIAAI